MELAQYQYLLPRLIGMWKHLERQEGAIGTRGPGETQLESDRRHIGRKISKLKEELAAVRKVRGTQRRRREKNAVPVAALVGYTNAGKSTLLNRLTGAEIPANDRLFDTLDTTTRRLMLEPGREILLSDTVGFIRKLPHHLVEAFKATLEELTYADVLLHVIDLSNPEWEAQAEVVDDLIRQLGAEKTPCLRVYNKCDAYLGLLPRDRESVCISARTGEGADRLLERLREILDRQGRRAALLLPYDRGRAPGCPPPGRGRALRGLPGRGHPGGGFPQRGPVAPVPGVCPGMTAREKEGEPMGESYLIPAGLGSAEIVEKRSRFLGRVWPVETEAEARQRIEETKKCHYDARHNCWCYVLREH